MERSVNRRPLLQATDSESDIPDNTSDTGCTSEDPIVYTSDTKPLFKSHEPNDKYYLCYFIFYLLGVTSLLPWNFFITADDYWMFKFRNVTNDTIKSTYKIMPGNRTPLQKEFTSYLSIASAVPNTLVLILSPFLNRWIALPIRMVSSILIIIILFIITTVFVKINTDGWQEEFFMLTMISVVILNVFSAVLSGSIFGFIGKFSPAYITAVVSGQALGGIFTALVQIVSLALGTSSEHSAFVYFIVGTSVCLLTFISYIVLAKSAYFNYHLSDHPDPDTGTIQAERLRLTKISYRNILKKIWLFGVSEWLVFVVTLCIYPGVTVLIESENKGIGNLWSDVYFVPVISYLIFSCGDYIGRILAGSLNWPKEKGLIILGLNLVRVIFIPLLLLCNAQPRHHMPVLITHDYYYIIIMCLFSFSNGYLANIAVISAPRVVQHHEKEVASSMMAAFLGVGLAIGSVLSLLMVRLI